MNKSELVDSVGDATGLDRRQSESAVKAVIDAVVNEIKSGGKVSIFGFGTFTPTSRAARVGRNPQTGAAVDIPASTGVKFAPATAVKALLNPQPVEEAPTKKAAAPSPAPAPAPAPAKKADADKKAAASDKKAADKKKSAKAAKKK